MEPHIALMNKSGLRRIQASQLRQYSDKVMRAVFARNGVFWCERDHIRTDPFSAQANRDALRIFESTVEISGSGALVILEGVGQDIHKLNDHMLAEIMYLHDHSSLTRIRQKAYAENREPMSLEEYISKPLKP